MYGGKFTIEKLREIEKTDPARYKRIRRRIEEKLRTDQQFFHQVLVKFDLTHETFFK